MLETRSNSQKEPATKALIVAHGQPSNQLVGESELRSLKLQVSRFLTGWELFSATLACPGSLEQVLKESEEKLIIFPMFMTSGWFTQTELPKRCGKSNVQILSPLGTLPKLPELTNHFLNEFAVSTGVSLENYNLLLAAHGSATGSEAAESTARFAKALGEFLPETSIQIGYLEQDPLLSSVAAKIGPKTLALPFFAMSGGHVSTDVPLALDEADFKGIRLPYLGGEAFIPKLIAETLANTSTQGSDL